MNPTAKHLAEHVLVGSGLEKVARRRLRDRILVLAYHNILPRGAAARGEVTLHLPQESFARQLDHLAQTCDVVPVSSLLSPPRSSERPRVVITFDDAYSDALGCGLEELVQRKMPATIFVSPMLLGTVTWWDDLAEKYGGAIPTAARQAALHGSGAGRPPVTGRRASARIRRGSMRSLPVIGTEAEVAHAAAHPGISIGSHSWTHADLSVLENSELQEELSRPVEWLQRFPSTIPWLSYPYGLSTSYVQSAAQKSGYAGAFRIDGGWAPRALESLYAIPRLNIPAGLSINGFRLRLAGF